MKNTHNTEQPIQQWSHVTKPLLHLNESNSGQAQNGIPFTITDYLSLVDWTGRVIRDDKRGAIAHNLPSILHRLGIDPRTGSIPVAILSSTTINVIGGLLLKQYIH